MTDDDEARTLERLDETGIALASNLDRGHVIETVTHAARMLVGADVAAFFERDVDGNDRIFAPEGTSVDALRALAALPRPAPGQRFMRMDDVRTEPIGSYLAVAVHARSGDPLGTLALGHASVKAFGERSERGVVVLAAQAAIALDNARLLEVERTTRLEIERVSLMKDEFLATLSHELRTPLNAILGWAQIILARPQPDAETRAGLEAIERNARAQAQLIDDLLDMNQIIAGKLRLDIQRIDPAPVIHAAMDTVRPSAEAKRIRLRARIDPETGPVFGDPSRLQQIVWNLLSNAIKFTPAGGTVDVDVERSEGFLTIAVQDTGTGIPAAFLPYVFERFRQADSSTARRYSGLGLGLSIARQLVELHGGSIHAASAGEGTGATFIVRLPAPS